MPLQNVRPLDLAPETAISFRVARWVLDEGDVRQASDGKVLRVPVLRLQVDAQRPPSDEPYIDVTSRGLLRAMLPWLDREDYRRYRFAVAKDGEGKAARYALRVEPGDGPAPPEGPSPTTA